MTFIAAIVPIILVLAFFYDTWLTFHFPLCKIEREKEREGEAIPSVRAFPRNVFLIIHYEIVCYIRLKEKRLFLHELIISAVKYFTVY